jgi:hypothetical protein
MTTPLADSINIRTVGNEVRVEVGYGKQFQIYTFAHREHDVLNKVVHVCLSELRMRPKKEQFRIEFR